MRVVLVPGFSQSPAAWDAVRDRLPVGIETVAPAVPDGLDFVATAHRLGERAGRGLWVGYSMGGRLALRLACDRPDLVDHLVLVSATAGIADPTERAARRASDHALAATVGELGVEEFLTRWLAQPLFADVAARGRQARDRADATTEAALTHQLRDLGQGRMEPLHDRLPTLEVPVTVIAGRADAKYTAIGREIAAAVPHGRFVALAGGHALPLVAPGPLAAALAAAHAATR